MSDRLSHLRSEIFKLTRQYAKESLAPAPFVPGETPIPPSGKLIDEEELCSMVDASLDGWLTTGRFNDLFEKQIADFIGVKHAMTVNSGSSANLVAFSTLTSPRLGDRAIRPGDEVISVAAGFPTTVNPILQVGAVPVFLDVQIGNYNIASSLIEAAITDKTKAVFLAHTLGNPFDLTTIKALCEKYDLWLVEDCCDALGSEYNGQKVGTFGDIATLSFYPAHHITMGEGGLVFTNRLKLKLAAESFRDWGRDCYCKPGMDNTCGKRFSWQLGDLPKGYDHKYIYSHRGFNLKITDMQAACGLAQLNKAPQFIETRRENFKKLTSLLSPAEDMLILPKATENSNPSWFGFPITVRSNAGVDRVDILKRLDERKVGTRLLFSGNLTKQPYMQRETFRVGSDLTQTDIVMNDTFWVGVQPALTEEMLEYSAREIIAAVRGD